MKLDKRLKQFRSGIEKKLKQFGMGSEKKLKEVEPDKREYLFPFEKTKYSSLVKLLKKVFVGAEVFSIVPLFIEVEYKSKKIAPDLRIRFNSTDVDIHDERYFDDSKKTLEIYNKKYLKKTEDFQKRFKRCMGEYSEIVKKY